MDLVDLYHLRGVSLVLSKLASTAAARRGYGRLAKRYAERIDSLRAPRSLEIGRLTPAL